MVRSFFLLVLLFSSYAKASECVGKIVNPITDICWSCIFPLSIGPVNIAGEGLDTENPSTPIYACPRPPLPVPVPGVTVGFWEPVYLVDVTRAPFCLVNMGGLELSSTHTGEGGVSVYQGNNKNSFYHVHVYKYLPITWMQILTDFVCLDKDEFNLVYVSEFDPAWNDESFSFLKNPEAALFSTIPAKAACGVDCAATKFGLPIDEIHWCAGCLGGMFPLTGHVAHHSGGVRASKLLTSRALAIMHRFMPFAAKITSGEAALCGSYSSPILKKSQYKFQMTYPVVENDENDSADGCKILGRHNLFDDSGKEYPGEGEDFGYLVWRKRNCVAF